MTLPPNRSHDISAYLRLIDDFVVGELTAPEFETAYLTAMKRDQRMIDNDVFRFLQTLFEDADAYVAEPRLRTEPEDLDDEQLRDCAIRARDGLRTLGFR